MAAQCVATGLFVRTEQPVCVRSLSFRVRAPYKRMTIRCNGEGSHRVEKSGQVPKTWGTTMNHLRSISAELRGVIIAGFLAGAVSLASAADWPRFRGPNGAGISTDAGVP